MPSSQVVVAVLMLLPGFVTAAVFNAISIRRKRSQFETISEVILFELLVVTSYALLARQCRAIRLPAPPDPALADAASSTLEASAMALLAIATLSASWGLVLGTLHNQDWILFVLRWCRVTKQSSHVTVWSGAFYNIESWVVVHLDSKVRIIGWPQQFADSPEESSVFLTQAAYLGDDGRVVEIPGAGILLTKEAGITMVEFVANDTVPDTTQQVIKPARGKRQ